MRVVLPPGVVNTLSMLLFGFAGVAVVATLIIRDSEQVQANTGPSSPAPAYSTPLPTSAPPTTPAHTPTTVPTHVITTSVVKYVYVTPPPAHTYPGKKPTHAPHSVPPTPSSSSSTPPEQGGSTPSGAPSSP